METHPPVVNDECLHVFIKGVGFRLPFPWPIDLSQ